MSLAIVATGAGVAEDASLMSRVCDILLELESATEVIDLQEVCRRLEIWNSCFHDIRPYYAVKANPDHRIIKALLDGGAGVDCASHKELVKAITSGANCATDVVISNPHKSRPELRAFRNTKDLSCTVVDSVCEIDKLCEEWPGCSVLVRLAVQTSNKGAKMEGKFGASEASCTNLIETLISRGITARGICIHIGSSGCDDRFDSFRSAIASIGRIMLKARETCGAVLSFIDLGGGFVWDEVEFSKQAAMLNAELDALKDMLRGNGYPIPKVVAEPGTFFVKGASVLVARIICVKDIAVGDSRGSRRAYVIDDGVFQSFNACLSYPSFFDSDVHVLPHMTKSRELYPSDIAPVPSILFGHTCDPCDVLSRDLPLPPLLEGDWLSFQGLGAYGTCVSSGFNGFGQPSVVYLD